ncbi:MAG: flagellar biosynthetic protein FliO [Bacteriovoracaceae bacterium]|nr:flagellar biosynthetic protein FliO [Bacteriovoracaceae bacterium]
MNRKLITLGLLTLASLSAQAGVKVTSLDLKTNGSNGYFNISLDGRSGELPDYRVIGKTIEVTLSDAESFNGIYKNVRGAQLSANVLNGKAIIKAVLPYEIKTEGVNLGWKNKNIEIIFPRGVAQVETTASVAPKPVVTKKTENKAVAKVETSSVAKEALNEDYLNNLMKEDTAKTAALDTQNTPTEIKKDEVNVSHAAPARTEVSSNDSFSFAGYAAKFAVFLAMVLGLFYGVVQLLKKGVFNRGKLGFLNNSQLIQVLSTTYVAPKRSLMVVKAHNQIFLVANAENGLTFLSEMTDTTGLIKEGEKIVTGTNFDVNMGTVENSVTAPEFKIKENITESTPYPEEKGIAALSAKDIVKFSDELKKKAKKLKPIEFN